MADFTLRGTIGKGKDVGRWAKSRVSAHASRYRRLSATFNELPPLPSPLFEVNVVDNFRNF